MIWVYLPVNVHYIHTGLDVVVVHVKGERGRNDLLELVLDAPDKSDYKLIYIIFKSGLGNQVFI